MRDARFGAVLSQQRSRDRSVARIACTKPRRQPLFKTFYAGLPFMNCHPSDEKDKHADQLRALESQEAHRYGCGPQTTELPNCVAPSIEATPSPTGTATSGPPLIGARSHRSISMSRSQ